MCVYDPMSPGYNYADVRCISEKYFSQLEHDISPELTQSWSIVYANTGRISYVS